ncbi:NAD(+) diphosphatase [Actinoplanes sp. NPDC089786]|uniref:NAD(+) diphosphatase n=1 Tax=Actinoplanes sp. NPDC089786 TaxID=3155185 RepID=UPI003421A44B
MTPPSADHRGERIPPLARTTLDRAAHHRRDPDWLAAAAKSGLVLVVDTAAGGRALAQDNPDGSASLVLLDPATAPDGDRYFLGVDPDGTPLFTVDAPLPAMTEAKGVTLRDVGHRLDDRDAGLFSAAAALVNWHVSHLFSPRSGKATEVTEAGWSRTDPDGKQMWPRTDPAMIVLIHDGVAGPGGRCLLGRNAQWKLPDGSLRFSTLAGFVEPGESAEAAVHREVLEEVGVKVRDLRYEGSQAWPYPGSLMLGFTARADAADPIVVDPDEIAEARWFTREEIAAMRADEYHDPTTGAPVRLPMSASIALYLIETWLGGFDQ